MVFESIKLAENRNFHNCGLLTCERNNIDVACNVYTRKNYTSFRTLKFCL
ncbi:MAG: hypothetical protein LBG92_05750 [Prevotellaceae bacterium]|nr:hypothetical protein [Prevotellaceae bacterium]